MFLKTFVVAIPKELLVWHWLWLIARTSVVYRFLICIVSWLHSKIRVGCIPPILLLVWEQCTWDLKWLVFAARNSCKNLLLIFRIWERIKAHKRTWTIEHNSMKKILTSNVHQRVVPLDCYFYGVSIQKVPRIVRQKTGKIPRNPIFLLVSYWNNTN